MPYWKDIQELIQSGRLVGKECIESPNASTQEGNKGYKHIHYNGKSYRAHRLAWELAYGKCRGLILHKCHNRACINLDHLYIGTHKDNAKDRDSIGRGPQNQPKGEDATASKLKEANVKSIRKEYAEGNTTLEKLADKYGTTFKNISLIVNRKRWKHV